MPADSLCQISADCCDSGSELIQMKDRVRGRGGGGGGGDILLMTEMAGFTTQTHKFNSEL